MESTGDLKDSIAEDLVLNIDPDDVMDTDFTNQSPMNIRIVETFSMARDNYRTPEALSPYLNTMDLGRFKFHIKENSHCQYSPYTGWHLQRGSGMMIASLTFEDIEIRENMIVRAVLVREDEAYKHFLVDRVCSTHSVVDDPVGNENVLQPTPGQDGIWFYSTEGPRNSLCFDVGRPDLTGLLCCTIGIRSVCSDTCNTSKDRFFDSKQRSRNLLMVLTLEERDTYSILARRSLRIWPKAVVRASDIERKTRRLPKGAASRKLELSTIGEPPSIKPPCKPVPACLTAALREIINVSKELQLTKEDFLRVVNSQYEKED